MTVTIQKDCLVCEGRGYVTFDYGAGEVEDKKCLCLMEEEIAVLENQKSE